MATVKISDAEITEGSGDLTFTLTLSEPAGINGARVTYLTEDQTATGSLFGFNNSDYLEAQSGVAYFTPGQISQTIIIDVVDDNLDEFEETLKVVLDASLDVLIEDSEGIGIIRPDDDAAPTISIKDASGYVSVPIEGFPDLYKVSFQVKLSHESGKTIQVEYSTSDTDEANSATASVDYGQMFQETLEFAPGEVEKTVEIELYSGGPVDDKTFEIFARDTAYRNWSKGADVDNGLPYGDLGYTVDRVFQGSDGFYAIGLTSNEKFLVKLNRTEQTHATISDSEAELTIVDVQKEPILVIRGTDPYCPWDWFVADLNPKGVGWNQYDDNKEAVKAWLSEALQSSEGLSFPSITGHSLGGALAQLFTADISSSLQDPLIAPPVLLNRVITFNSPGLKRKMWFSPLFGENLPLSYIGSGVVTQGVRHYITSGDLVSLAGDEYLPGEYILSTYDSSPLDIATFKKHSIPILATELAGDGKNKPNFIETHRASTNELGSASFTYNKHIQDENYVQFIEAFKIVLGITIYAIPIPNPFASALLKPALRAFTYDFLTNGINRGNIEGLREFIGEVGYPLIQAIVSYGTELIESGKYIFNDAVDSIETITDSVSTKLFSNVKSLVLTGSADINGIGNEIDNRLVGNSGNNLLEGKEGNDLLLGELGNDFLIGGFGNDVLIGGSGRDTQTGSAGFDRFVFSGMTQATAFSTSTLVHPDHITDFNPTQGDRIQLDLDGNLATINLPRGLFNSGKKSGRTLVKAIKDTYADKDQKRKGRQQLKANESVFFYYRGKTYLSVNDRRSAFSSNHDLVIDVTGIEMKPKNFKAGSLNARNYFA
jgi:hypothetical protein